MSLCMSARKYSKLLRAEKQPLTPYLLFLAKQCLDLQIQLVILHLMTGPKENSEFSFPKILNVSRGEAQGNIGAEGNLTSLPGLLYLPTQNEKTLQRNRLVYAGWFISFLLFQGALPNYVRVEI